MAAIHHVGCGVLDLEREVAFYEAAIDAHQVSADQARPSSAGAGEGVLLRAANVHLELTSVDPAGAGAPRSVVGPGITHLCVQGDRSQGLLGRLERAGATLPREPVRLTPHIQYLYARDPEDNILELEQYDEASSDPPIWPAHVGVATRDIAASERFYSALFDVAPVASARLRDRAEVDAVAGLDGVDVHWRMYDLGPFKFELWQYVAPLTPVGPPAPHDARGWNHLAIEVDDLDVERERLTTLGAAFDDTAVRGASGLLLRGRDPDGLAIELIEPSPGLSVRDLAEVHP